MQVLVELQGVRGIQDLVERASKETKKRLEAACRETAAEVAWRARQLAPRDRGDLASAIKYEGRGTRWRVGVEDRRIPERGGDLTRRGRRGRMVGAVNSAHVNPAVYGVWYELGFTTRRIARKPFMNPAAESQAEAHEQRILQALTNGLGVTA